MMKDKQLRNVLEGADFGGDPRTGQRDWDLAALTIWRLSGLSERLGGNFASQNTV
jgi:hypothetical protein